jgi:hypothetical protein
MFLPGAPNLHFAGIRGADPVLSTGYGLEVQLDNRVPAQTDVDDAMVNQVNRPSTPVGDLNPGLDHNGQTIDPR